MKPATGRTHQMKNIWLLAFVSNVFSDLVTLPIGLLPFLFRRIEAILKKLIFLVSINSKVRLSVEGVFYPSIALK